MKRTLFVLLTLAGISNASAFATSLAPRQTIAAVQNLSAEIQNVEVDNYGEATIQMRNGQGVTRKQLSLANHNSVYYDALMLGNAEIEVTHHTIVCMMMPSPYQPMLQVSGLDDVDQQSFTGVLHNVLSTNSCASMTSIAPKEEYQARAADLLRTTLIVLANEYAQATN